MVYLLGKTIKEVEQEDDETIVIKFTDNTSITFESMTKDEYSMHPTKILVTKDGINNELHD